MIESSPDDLRPSRRRRAVTAAWRMTGGAVVSVVRRPFRRGGNERPDADSSDDDGAMEAIIVDDAVDDAADDAADDTQPVAPGAAERVPDSATTGSQVPALPRPRTAAAKRRQPRAAIGRVASVSPAAPAVFSASTEAQPTGAVRLPTGSIERTRSGAAWWRYRRPGPPRPVEAHPPRAPIDSGNGSPVDSRGGDGNGSGTGPPGETDTPQPEPHRTGIEGAPPTPSAVVPAGLAALLVAVLLINGRFDSPAVSRVLVPVVGVAAAIAFGRHLARRHPDEPWLPQFLLAGVLFKLFATWLRYITFEGGGDAVVYDQTGRQFAAAWFGDGPHPDLTSLRETNFVRWACGVVYEAFGPDMITGFLVFGLLAFVGTYLWYRGAVMAVPFIDKRLYLALVLFAPSIAFWPASIGKESLMQLGFGFITLGVANLMHHRVLRGLLIAAPGGWLLWVVRPHLLAMATIAVGLAFLFGRRTTMDGAPPKAGFARPIGAVALAILVAFAVSAAADGLGIEQLSVQGLEQELEETNESTSQGSGRFESGGGSLSPLALPQGAATVLLRPFPWEVESSNQLISSLESAALAAFIFVRRRSLLLSLTRARTTPFLLYCWTLTIIYCATFSSFGNFGLLVRQRSLVLPALLVLLSLDVVGSRTSRSDDPPTAVTRGSRSSGGP